MNKKFAMVMIAIWSVIALVLIGLLVFFIIHGHGSGWNWNWNSDDSDNNMTQYIDKSFASSDISEISLNASNADVSFSKTQGEDIKVSINGSGSSDSKDIFSVSQDGNTLKITQKYKSWTYFIHLFNSSDRISITLPESYKKDLTLNVTSGDISFDGDYTFGKAEIYKTSGDLKADSLKAGTLKIKTVSGNISVSKLDAHYEISSTSGDMDFNGLAGYGSFSSVSGNLKCNVSELSGALDISAISGDVGVTLPKDADADIYASTTSGDINSDFNMSYSGHNKNHAEATLGSPPYNKVSVSLTSGDIDFTYGE